MRKINAEGVVFASAVLIGVAQTGTAGTLQEIRPDFLAGCQGNGNEEPVCACMFDNWSADIPPEKETAARSAIMMFLGQQPESNEQMMEASRLLQSMSGVLMSCATSDS